MKKSFDEVLKLFLSETVETNSNVYPYLANKKTFDSRKDSVYYSGPFWNELEVEAAIESLLFGKWLSSGEKVNQFERRFSKKFGFTNSVMVNSGSSANLIMVSALKKFFGWNDGDEILVSAVGFPTTISAILQNNLKPVFVDIDYSDLNWNIDLMEKLISAKTKAVFSSPVLGNPYDVDRILELCSRYGIEIIADNCDSLGSTWKSEYLTEHAIAASCSFYPAHHITTMEGGMVSSKSEEIVEIARSLAWWGRACYCVGRQNLLPDGTCKKRFSKWINDCDEIVDHKYVFTNVGYNLKPLDLQGAIGLVQLDKFDIIEEKRRSNYVILKRIMETVPGCRIIEERKEAKTSWFGLPVVCDSPVLKRSLVSFFEKNRVQTRNYFAGNILQQPAYRSLGDFKEFPRANRVLSDVFFLGVGPTITSDMLEYIEALVNNFTSN